MEKFDLKEMETDLCVLAKMCDDWKQSLKSFDEDWENVVRIHDEQRNAILSQIEANNKTREELQKKYDTLKHTLIVNEDCDCELVDAINEYYAEYGITSTFFQLCQLIAKKKCCSELLNSDQVKAFLNNECGCYEYQLIVDFLQIEEE